MTSNVADDACKRIPPPFANCTKGRSVVGPRGLASCPSSPPLLVVGKAVAAAFQGVTASSPVRVWQPRNRLQAHAAIPTRGLLLPLALAEAEPRMAIRGTPPAA